MNFLDNLEKVYRIKDSETDYYARSLISNLIFIADLYFNKSFWNSF